MMFLKQIGDAIHFGTDTHWSVLSTSRVSHFKREDVNRVEAELIAAYPEQADGIRRLAERLRKMV